MIYLKPFRLYRRRIIHRKGVIDHTLPREGIQTSFIFFPDLRYSCLCGNSFVANCTVIYLVLLVRVRYLWQLNFPYDKRVRFSIAAKR